MGDSASSSDASSSAAEVHEDTAPRDAPGLQDPWDRHPPIPLAGLLERQQFPPLLTAILALILALVLFQVVITPVVLVLLLVVQGVQVSDVVGDLPALMAEQAHTIISANTAGQVLALAVPAFVLARLHSARPQAFLRLRSPDGRLLVLALIGLVTLMPVVQWLGTVNEWLPLPEAIREFDRQQMDLVERVLRGDLGVIFSLLTLAVTPALCEEFLFRGYVQRQAERGLGAAGGVVLSGLIFGLYHLRLTQALPLITLGLYLAYLAWRTGSLWVPIVVHFANNAFAVALGLWADAQQGMDLQSIEQLSVPWYLVIGGALLSVGTIYLLHRRAQALLGETTADLPTASVIP